MYSEVFWKRFIDEFITQRHSNIYLKKKNLKFPFQILIYKKKTKWENYKSLFVFFIWLRENPWNNFVVIWRVFLILITNLTILFLWFIFLLLFVFSFNSICLLLSYYILFLLCAFIYRLSQVEDFIDHIFL